MSTRPWQAEPTTEFTSTDRLPSDSTVSYHDKSWTPCFLWWSRLSCHCKCVARSRIGEESCAFEWSLSRCLGSRYRFGEHPRLTWTKRHHSIFSWWFRQSTVWLSRAQRSIWLRLQKNRSLGEVVYRQISAWWKNAWSDARAQTWEALSRSSTEWDQLGYWTTTISTWSLAWGNSKSQSDGQRTHSKQYQQSLWITSGAISQFAQSDELLATCSDSSQSWRDHSGRTNDSPALRKRWVRCHSTRESLARWETLNEHWKSTERVKRLQDDDCSGSSKSAIAGWPPSSECYFCRDPSDIWALWALAQSCCTGHCIEQGQRRSFASSNSLAVSLNSWLLKRSYPTPPSCPSHLKHFWAGIHQHRCSFATWWTAWDTCAAACQLGPWGSVTGAGAHQCCFAWRNATRHRSGREWRSDTVFAQTHSSLSHCPGSTTIDADSCLFWDSLPNRRDPLGYHHGLPDPCMLCSRAPSRVLYRCACL